MAKIPELPKIDIRVHEDVSRPNGGKYLRLRHPELTLGYPSGTESKAFVYDMIVRDALDAAVVAAHFPSENGTMIVLRSAVRPPVALRHVAPKYDGSMWELCAGLIEVGEDGRAAAVRELDEEIGAKVTLDQMKDLGTPTFPAPGVIGERHRAPIAGIRERRDDPLALRDGPVVAAQADADVVHAGRRDLADGGQDDGCHGLRPVATGSSPPRTVRADRERPAAGLPDIDGDHRHDRSLSPSPGPAGRRSPR